MVVGARGRVCARACVMSCAAARGLHSNAYTWLAGWNSPHPCDAAGGASRTPPSPPSHPERVQQRPLSSASHVTLLRQPSVPLLDGGERGEGGEFWEPPSHGRADRGRSAQLHGRVSGGGIKMIFPPLTQSTFPPRAELFPATRVTLQTVEHILVCGEEEQGGFLHTSRRRAQGRRCRPQS